MFEHKTFDVILQEMLDRVPADVDKREGAVIFDALAPVAMEVAEAYTDLDRVLRLTFADTADGEFLERRVGEHGVQKKKASAALRSGVFTDTEGKPLNVAIGSRYRLDDVVYAVVASMGEGAFTLRAETLGAIGNRSYGLMLPLEPDNNLGSAILEAVLIPGEDDETDEALYEKFLEHINEVAFGGNRADYKRKIMNIAGVGGVQLIRAPAGGGTVRAIIIDSEFSVPSQELVDEVQETIDPVVYGGDGYGTAPIGHLVSVEAVETVIIDIQAEITLTGVTLGQIMPQVQAVIDDYLKEIRESWNRGYPLTVRISHLESRILDLEGVQDIANTLFNGEAKNIVLQQEIPIKGEVVLNE